MDDPNADTEWNDILREKGILGPKEEDPYDVELDLRAEIHAQAKEQEKNLDNKDLDDIDALLEDDLDDDRILQEYRAKRMQEMHEFASKQKFGSVYPISKPDFIREVTDASKETPVVANLFKDYLPASKLLSALIERIAAKYRATKFVKIVGDQCIPNYPDRNMPTLLIYIDGEPKTQLVTLATIGGMNTKQIDVERYLASIGAIEMAKSTEEGEEEEPPRRSIFGQSSRVDSEDDDDD